MEELNYYLFIVGATHPDEAFVRGDCGTGLTPVGPGIKDCPYGTLYVIPRDYIKYPKPNAQQIKRAVVKYYLGGGRG